MTDLFVHVGQVSDHIGTRTLLSSLAKVKWMLRDRGYDADWFRHSLQDKGIRASIPVPTKCKTPVKFNKHRNSRRNWTEIMFGRLKYWRRVTTRSDRCPKVFLSAIPPRRHRHVPLMNPDPCASLEFELEGAYRIVLLSRAFCLLCFP